MRRAGRDYMVLSQGASALGRSSPVFFKGLKKCPLTSKQIFQYRWIEGRMDPLDLRLLSEG